MDSGNWSHVDSQNQSNFTGPVEDFSMHTDYMKFVNVLEKIQHVLSPTLLVVGLICNGLTIYAVADKRFRQLNTQIMLISLALTDTLVLFSAFFNQKIARDLFGRDVRGDTRVGCKTFIVFYRTGKVFASWIVVFVAIERFIAVVFPLHVKTLVNRKTSIIALSVVFVGVMSFNAAWSFSSEILNHYCVPSLHNPDTERLHDIFNIIRGIQYSFLPIVILLSVTPPIIYKLVQSHRRREAMTANATRSTKDLTRTTLMLIMVVLLHIISSIPLTLYFIQEVIYNESVFQTTRTSYAMIYRLQPTLEGLNHSSNFIVYIMFSRQFRQRLMEKIWCPCHAIAYFVHVRLIERRRELTESSDTIAAH